MAAAFSDWSQEERCQEKRGGKAALPGFIGESRHAIQRPFFAPIRMGISSTRISIILVVHLIVRGALRRQRLAWYTVDCIHHNMDAMSDTVRSTCLL